MTGPAPQSAKPRPSPAVIRGQDYPFRDAEKSRKADYMRRLMRDTEADAVARYKIAARNMLFADGRQHIDWSLRDRTWMDAPNAPGEIRTVANYIRPILRSRLSRILSGDFVWRAVPRSNADDDRDQAAVAENLVSARWDTLTMDNRLRYALWLSFTGGVSFLKSFWNPNLGSLESARMVMPVGPNGEPLEVPVDAQGQPVIGEDGQPGTPDQGYRYHLGDTDVAVRSLFNIRVNADAYGLDVAEGFRWLIDSEVVPRSVVQERYGIELKTAKVADTHQQSTWERIVKSVGHAFGTGADRYASADAPESEDSVLLSEYWEPATETMRGGRLLVMAGDEELYDGDLPQGIVPYVPVYDERRPFDAFGRATTNDLVPPQRTVNRMLSLILQELRAEGTGQWMGFDLAGVFDQLSNETNAHIKIPVTTQTMAMGLDRLVARVPKTAINQSWLVMLDEAKKQMFDIGAFHEIQRGQVPPGVDSGVAVQYLMEAENAQLHDTVRTLKATLIQWGRHQLTLARWGYGPDEERWLRVHRDDLGFMLENVTGADLPDPEMVDLDVDGFEPASKAAYRADIKDLMDKGQLDPRTGLKLLDLGRGVAGAYESQTRHYAKARAENLVFERGEAQPVVPPGGDPGFPIYMNPDGSPMLLTRDDDHGLHVERHNEIALDTSKPWPLRMAVLAHIEAHRQAASTQMMEAQAQMAPQEPRGTTSQEAPR